MIKVLLSAYACEPNKGSEPGLGWNAALQLASRISVIVITRANNSHSIEQAMASLSPGRQLEFIYHDLSRPLLLFKKFLGAHRLYYLVWQRSLQPQISRIVSARGVSLIHHATYASFRYPTAVLGHGVPAIWGPVGGVEVTPWNLMPWTHPVSLAYEVARSAGIARHRHFPHNDWSRYARVLAATEETRQFFNAAGIKADLLPAIGLDGQAGAKRPSQEPHLRLLFVGPLHYLKGVQFAIEALASLEGATLTVVGTGSFESTLRRLTHRFRVRDRVHFTGQIPHAELNNIYSSHDVFVFPSLHDSGGIAVLEGMSAKLPVICLNCGGPALSVSDECGFKIAPSSRRAIVKGIREAIQQYSSDRMLLAMHGRAAQNRVESLYAWPNKVTRLLQIYDEVLAAHTSCSD